MGKSVRAPVLCPYRVPGLEMRVLGPCWLLVWGRTKQGGQLQDCHLRSCWGSICCGKVLSLWGQQGGLEVPGMVPMAGGGTPRGSGCRSQGAVAPTLAPRCLGSLKGQFCLLKRVAFCFDE